MEGENKNEKPMLVGSTLPMKIEKAELGKIYTVDKLTKLVWPDYIPLVRVYDGGKTFVASMDGRWLDIVESGLSKDYLAMRGASGTYVVKRDRKYTLCLLDGEPSLSCVEPDSVPK